jgi:NADH-quinone oxidoreductase subunit F
MRIEGMAGLEALRKKSSTRIAPKSPMATVGLGTCGIGNGALDVFEALKESGAKTKRVGCFGFCAAEPAVMLYYPGKPILLFTEQKAQDAKKLAQALESPEAFDKAAKRAQAKIEKWDFILSQVDYGSDYDFLPSWEALPFFRGQKKVVLRDSGLIDPESIEDYIAVGGYSSLAKALFSMGPEAVLAEVDKSKLRGRGGAGFPTGRKWGLMRAQASTERYVICNADEGDPGAYMNRNEIESDPHMLLEGMILGAFAMGAQSGFIYVRAEYPLAVERLRLAIAQAREAGLLGEKILGSDYSFDLDIVMGAGAFVCGEETALIASAEGKSGRPVPRPPFPAQRGFRGAPTNINNVETWCNVPVIVGRGGEWFTQIGADKSAGTKVFSLVGKVRNTGLVELPLGSPLDSMVYGMGGGAGPNKRIRAVQSGGPSGGCVPAELLGTSVDYESLASIGAIMGSGGMVVMDRDNCMVDVARYFVSFTSAESCGKCVSCREGLSQMLRILERVTRGEAKMSDLDELERLARVVKDSALCQLGQTAANPILTTLKYFREEYERHIRDKRCDSGVCESLYQALCENSCPMHMNIPAYLALLQEGRIEEAFEITLRDNPLPGTLGRICHFHCQMRCRRETLDESVHQGEIHRYLADTMYKMGREKNVWNRLAKERLEASGKKIAVIGAGPAGLAASFYLQRLGHEVTVYDSHDKAGGILRYGIPSYRLPKDVLDKELELWKKLGVRFVFDARVGRDLKLESLSKQYDAVLVCVGAEGDRPLGIPGEDMPGVHAGYGWLDAFGQGKKGNLGKRVLVIGGGNVAIDAARTLFRLEKDVMVAYRRTRADMPANSVEIQGAEEEGIGFRFMLSPSRILADKEGKLSGVRFDVMKAGAIDKSGRPKPEPSGKTIDIPCDDVIVAAGEVVDAADISVAGLALTKDGRVKTDPFDMHTSLPNVWAAGDAVTGPATAAEAMGQAKSAAREIDLVLSGKDRFNLLFREIEYGMDPPEDVARSKMNRSKQIPPEARRGNFIEISQGYSGDQAALEAARCLRCDLRKNARSPWR